MESDMEPTSNERLDIPGIADNKFLSLIGICL